MEEKSSKSWKCCSIRYCRFGGEGWSLSNIIVCSMNLYETSIYIDKTVYVDAFVLIIRIMYD